jgi:hypothetical protein
MLVASIAMLVWQLLKWRVPKQANINLSIKKIDLPKLF